MSMLTAEPGLASSDFSPNVAVELAALSMAPRKKRKTSVGYG